MKQWEQAGMLTDLLDRHMQLLLATRDLTIYWHLPALLSLLHSEPALASLVSDYLDDLSRSTAELQANRHEVARALSALYDEHEDVLLSLRGNVNRDRWSHHEFDRLGERLRGAMEEPSIDAIRQIVLTLQQWIALGEDRVAERWREPTLARASEQFVNLANRTKQLERSFEQLTETHPGAAFLALQVYVKSLDRAATGDPLADEMTNRHVEEHLERIRRAEQFSEASDQRLARDVALIHRHVRTLHLALVTSLAKGQSRWVVLQRFGARCEMFDREELLDQLAADAERRGTGNKKPEAVLTLALARYLFDAGFNPLVDAAACGLRPDVLDATTEPKVFVEAKQYERIGPRIANKMRSDVAQTLNTWARLSKRWHTPEAFLVVFRRSGRHIDITHRSVRAGCGHLYVLCIDLGPPSQSGSKAGSVVKVDARDLVSESA